MLRHLLIGASALLVAGAVSAAPLTPGQALERLENEGGQRLKSVVRSADSYSLAVLPQLESEVSARLYVFTDADAGFIITPSDSEAPALLGYGTGFDADDIPESMRWWLGEYARQIAWLAEHPRTGAPDRATHTAVSPLVTTSWNQSDPYNRKCPLDGSRRSVTGCVATAMAQVVNYHEWPQANGTGTYSYTWNGQTLSFNYGATTFDWAHMANTYSASSSTTACNAVATLMYGCGVSVEMEYSSSSSGAMSYRCASALVRNFGYDQGAVYVMRDYFSAAEWDELIYAELAAGRPVLYNGQSSSGGHAFVCDGYDGRGNYHINWGWGGISDGYFLLSALDPYEQGIGGSDSGYNYNQGAAIGVQAPVDGSERSMALYANGGFEYSTRYSCFWFGQNSNGGNNGYFNYSEFTFDAITGVRLEGADGFETFVAGETSNFKPLYGYASISPMFPADLPAGTYKAYPAARYADSEAIHDILVPYGQARYVTVRKGNNGVITYDGSDPDAVELPVRVTEITQNEDWIPGEDVSLRTAFTNSSSSSQELKLNLLFSSVKTRDTYKIGPWSLQFDANERTAYNLRCGVCQLPEGVYTVTAVDVSKNAVISDPYPLYVGIRPVSVTVTPGEAEIAIGESAQLAAAVSPSDAFDTTVSWTSSDPAIATVDADGKVTGVSSGTVTVTATSVNGLMSEAEVTVTDVDAAIESIEADGARKVDVYNMQGIRVRRGVARNGATSGLPAGVYIIDGERVLVK